MKLRTATQVAPRFWRQLARRLLIRATPSTWVLAAGPSGAGTVCLTFDDGPDPTATSRVLEALAAGGAHATFFLQGAHVAANLPLVRRIHAEGHEIGHHSWSHGAPETTTAAELADETVRTRDLLRSTLNVDVRIFRPPHGKLTAAKVFRLISMRQTIVLWTSDPGDRYQRSADDLVAWFRKYPPKSGEIVLLHDSAPALVDALPHIIAIVRQQGLDFARVSDWLPKGRHRRSLIAPASA